MNKPKYFKASWCGSCGTVTKYITENNIDVEIKDLDIDENKAEALALGIRSIPCLILPNGDRVVGLKIKEYFEAN